MKVRNLIVFSKRLRHARIAKGLSQLDLAQEVVVSLNSVKGWERGSASINGVNLTNVSYALGVSKEYLAGYDDEGGPIEEMYAHSPTRDDNSVPNLDGLKKYVSRLMDNNNLSGKKRIVVGHALAIIETTLNE